MHIGPHKTGTTAIQNTFAQSRDLLAEHGVLYPGTKVCHHYEAKALIRLRQGWKNDGEEPPPTSVWTTFAHQLRDTPGRIVISSEFLSEADASQRADLVNDLGADRVHLLVGARNPAALAVSNWQQVIRTYGRSEELDSWLEDSFRRDETTEPNRFWRRADTAALVRSFLEVLPLERITVVALDENNRRLLPNTFEQLLGLPEGLLADQQTPRANRGLTAVEITFIRRINALLDGHVRWDEYTRAMREGVIPRVLKRTPEPGEGKVPMPQWALEQSVAEADRNIAGLEATGVTIAGDLAPLRALPTQTALDAPITQLPMDLAAQAVLGGILSGRRYGRSLEREKKRAQRAQKKQKAQARSGQKKQAARAPEPAPTLDDLDTRQLAAALARRVGAKLRRR
ncbi:hypothetical protein [Jatrophihabitans endophyticus]|uniref:hypothetical protein n=1 Tax=Jatrophihabitans endophyticus TaxID=1206085 RepID=UPI0019E2A388|nr:hypothetical protein [Jatrophihabitans endophyticus]MBE7187923.1 hypothetical protein [Jatrophihabitans endophyticus]